MQVTGHKCHPYKDWLNRCASKTLIDIYNFFLLVNFRQFPRLKTLEIPLNNISGTVFLEDKDFVWLETLDLSCNHLTTEDVLALSVLPALKVLHLTGNISAPTRACRLLTKLYTTFLCKGSFYFLR